MNDHNALYFLNKYRKKGILVDTNLLLLYIVGSVNTKLIKDFKRTNIFEEADYVKVANYIEKFEVKVTTPCILTETSNLLAQIQKEKEQCIYALKESISIMEENYVPSSEISENVSFQKFGLTDSSIVQIAKDEFVVFTVDLPLYHYLSNEGFDVLNYNHIRQF